MIKQYILTLFLLCTWSIGLTQSSNELALEYYRKGEFQKAIPILEELYTTNRMSSHLDMLIDSYKQSEDYKSAEKFIKKLLKQDKNNQYLKIELGYLYEATGEVDKANKVYESAIEELLANQHMVIELGKVFASKKKYKLEEKTYLKGRKLIKTDYTFSFELAQTYLHLREFEKMISEYVDLIRSEESYMQSVQANLQSLLYYDSDKSITTLLKNKLIAELQKYPNNDAINELFLWLMIQEKEFEAALFQAKAIDKRKNQAGMSVFQLGKLALSNDNYLVAADAFQYLIEKGDMSNYFKLAKKKYIEARSKYIFSTPNAPEQDIKKLEQLYISTINELGKGSETIDIIRDLAHLQTFYLNKYQQAIDSLDNATKTISLNRKEKHKTLMTLAECYLFSGDIWEANLLYAKVEKENSNNTLGFEAKLMRAKISYYSGEFQWAKSLLDILKASTSKLIANDAFELALLINDNTALDTTTEAMRLYAHADFLLYQKKDSLCMATLDSIPLLFPKHSLIDEIEYKKAEIAMLRGNIEQAAKHYEAIVNNYEYDIYGDNAIFYLAELNEKYFNNPEKALELYKKIVLEHSNSIFISEARKRYRSLRGDDIN